MEIPDTWIVDVLAKSIDKPDAEARADKLARLFCSRHLALRDRALAFLERVAATLREA